jgi:predicted nucleotidyltransferase
VIDLEAQHLETIQRILRLHLPNAEVRAFGSRVTGTAKSYSDLDLAILAPKRVTAVELAQLRLAFEESDLPFRIDLVDWHAISLEFRQIVEQQFEILQVPQEEGK